jgi:hypothetical protein
MTPCLTPEEFVDLVDGTLPPLRGQHLDGCATCRATAVEVREALALVADDDVPEAPAFFWSSLNARVRAEIERQPRAAWRRWLRWDVVMPVAAVAVVVAAVVVSIGPATSESPRRAAVVVAPADLGMDPTESAGTIEARDAALALVADLSQVLPDGGWDVLGVTTLPDLADAAQVLSVEEQAALAELLRTAVDRPKS